MRRRDDRRQQAAEQTESRQTLSKADATVFLVDKALERLERAASLYRQRLEGTR